MNQQYRVKFEIDVDAASPTDAAEQAWHLLSGSQALLPIAEMTDEQGEAFIVDLEAVKAFHRLWRRRYSGR